jgi:hypothetical protein
MRHFAFTAIASMFLLAACNDAKKPSVANFTTAIDQYLTKHGEACTAIGQAFPVNIPKSEPVGSSGIGAKMAALQEAGLVHATETTAVVHSMLDPLRGSTPPQPVKQYDLTGEGEKHVRQIPAIFGHTTGLCYGHKSIASIIKWTEPTTVEADTQAEVSYTYKIPDLAPWAERPNVQQAFPDVRAVVSGISSATQTIGLHLTNHGWEPIDSRPD